MVDAQPMAADSRSVVVVPPSLELLPGLFAPSATLAGLRRPTRPPLRDDVPYRLDAERLTLAEIVDAVRSLDAERVSVAEPADDPAVARRIAAALADVCAHVLLEALPALGPPPLPADEHVVRLPASPPGDAELAAAIRAAAASCGGAYAVRLAFAEPRVPADPGDGACWAARYGLDDPGWRGALQRLSAAELPHAAVALHAAIGFQRLAVHPLLEMLAGNGIVERNAELLANIVP